MVRSILLGIIVVSVLVTPVSAQTAAQTHPLDESREKIGEVSVDGKAYTIYEYENALPYASGVEVFVGGERVTSKQTARTIFTAYSRKQCDCFGPGTSAKLERIVENTEKMNQSVATTLEALNETIEYTEKLKNRDMNGTTAWKVATNHSSTLADTYKKSVLEPSKARQLRSNMVELRSAINRLNREAEQVKTLVEKRKAGEKVDQRKLYQQYTDMRTALKAVRNQLTEMQDSFAGMSQRSAKIASNAKDTPEVGGMIHEKFTKLSDQLSRTADRSASVSGELKTIQSELPTFSKNEELVARLLEQWEKRQGAPAKIYATMGEIVLVLFAGLFAFGEMR